MAAADVEPEVAPVASEVPVDAAEVPAAAAVAEPPAASDSPVVVDDASVAPVAAEAPAASAVAESRAVPVASESPTAAAAPAVADVAPAVPVGTELPGVPASAETSAVPAPPMPTEPPLPPAAAPEAQPTTPRKDRRALRAVLRWGAAVVVFAVVGAGTAYGIAGMKRSDVPGLGTASDGRWAFPTVTKPALPAGSPGPFATANAAGAHFADLRALVLPAPKGAVADKALDGSDGWLATKVFLAEFSAADDRTELAQKLTDQGLRHIAARGWTTADGTHTRIYLLQFDTATVADEITKGLAGYASPTYPVRGADGYESDDDFPDAAKVTNVQLQPYVETKPYGPEQVRLGFVTAGDTLAMIVQSRKGQAAAVPFQQTVTLQSELLG
ncbi:hypothetical protein [Streptomyces sp. 3213.3]|uniref:hypothetical protein n=1 Tax=Streptomyces sp. 3213.3 TaxID=1855348 RepID=UPI002E0E628F